MSQQIPIIFSNERTKPTESSKGLLRSIIISMRLHQWVKNLFIFAPLLFGRKLTDMTAIGNSLLAFAAFCCVASGLYIINDIIDAEEDRAHPEKRFRPISSGALPMPIAIVTSIVLIGGGLWIALTISINVFLIAALYFILTLAYCLALKKMILLDGMTISAGFVLRIVGGAFAVGVMPTHWLIVCAFLLASFLAFTKRRQELLILSDNAGEHREVLNKYSVRYLDQVNTILISAAIVCYALYAVAPETVEKFQTGGLIYGTAFVIYGMLRYMALIKDPANGGNPSKMLLHDRPIMLTVAGWAIYNAVVIYHITLSELWMLLFK